MAQVKKLVIALLVCAWVLLGCVDQAAKNNQASHIAGNAPKAADFETFLHRDLTSHFKSIHGGELEVQYEFLREGHTQSGTSYPKYYLWVKVIQSGSTIEEGAVRCAAIGTTHFEVTDFLTKTSLLTDPSQAAFVFPAPVCDRLAEKVKG